MAGYKRVNFYELCRLCATNQQKDKTHIFQEEGRKIQLQTKIQSCLSLTVCENDFLPKVVCSKCLRTLEVCYSFRQECVTSETMLSSYFKNFRYTEDFKKSGKVYIKDTTINKCTISQETTTNSSTQSNVINPVNVVSDIKQMDHVPFYTLQLPTIVTNQAAIENTKPKISESKPVQNLNQSVGYNLNTINLSAIKTLPKVSNDNLNNVVVNANGEVINIAQLVDLESIINQATFPKTKTLKNSVKKEKSEPIIKIDLTGSEIDNTYDTQRFEKVAVKNAKFPYNMKMDESKLNAASVILNNLQEFNQNNFNNYNGNNLYHPNLISNSNVIPESTVNLNVLNQELNQTQTYNRSFTNQPKTSEELLNQTIKTHICEICHKSFKRKEHLYQHVKLHTGFRPYSCENCNKAFMRKEHLLRHMTSHSGQKNFTCNICDKSFSRNDNLLKHKKTHEKQTSYTCDICQKQFVMKHYYLAHKLTHDSERCGLSNVWNALKA